MSRRTTTTQVITKSFGRWPQTKMKPTISLKSKLDTSSCPMTLTIFEQEFIFVLFLSLSLSFCFPNWLTSWSERACGSTNIRSIAIASSISNCALSATIGWRTLKEERIYETCQNASNMASSAPTIPRVQFPSTPSMLFSICIEIVTRKERKIKQKRGRDWPIFIKKHGLN